MSTTILRTLDTWWVQVDANTARPIATDAVTTGELLGDRASIDAAVADDSLTATSVGDLKLISPVTQPCRVVAQMTNYKSHVTDAGGNPAHTPLTFFRKTSGSISGPFDDIVRPAHVRLLDYEIEIGLVIGSSVEVGSAVKDWTDHVAALVVTNDVSARDVQLPKTQFFEGKSYPTFTPVGPRLVLLEPGELRRFEQLRMRLTVNDRVRQDAVVGGDIIFAPAEALTALARFQRLDPGDLVLTGTPVGTALSAPPKPIELIGSLLPAHVKWKAFLKRQSSNTSYLQDGDVIEASVATDDGAIDLGTQRTVVRHA